MMHRRNNSAMSELLGVIYILMISTTLISAVYVWAPQQLEDRKAYVRSESSLKQFQTINDVLQDTVSFGAGSSKSVNFVTDEGYLHLGSGGTKLIIFYPLYKNFEFHVAGFNPDGEDYDESKFTYIQRSLPDWWGDLAEDDKKIMFDVSYPNDNKKSFTFESDVYYLSYPNLVDYPIQFTDVSSDWEGTITKWEWDFNYDGTTFKVMSTDRNPGHEYSESGRYTVRLKVTDDDGDSSFMQHDVVVGTDTGLTSAFSCKPINAKTEEEVEFYDESTFHGGEIYSWDWNFGDGETSTDQNPTHSYAFDSGIYNSEDDGYPYVYTVLLTVNGDASWSHTVEVDYDPPTANFRYVPESPINPGLGNEVSFFEDSIDPNNILEFDILRCRFFWEFDYDGVGSVSPETSIDRHPDDIIFDSPGTYTVRLTVTDGNGKTSFMQHDVVVLQGEMILCYDLDGDGDDASPVGGEMVLNWLAGWCDDASEQNSPDPPRPYNILFDDTNDNEKYDGGDSVIITDCSGGCVPDVEGVPPDIVKIYKAQIGKHTAFGESKPFIFNDANDNGHFDEDEDDTLLWALEILYIQPRGSIWDFAEIAMDMNLPEAAGGEEPEDEYFIFRDGDGDREFDGGSGGIEPYAAFSYMPTNPKTREIIRFAYESVNQPGSSMCCWGDGTPCWYKGIGATHLYTDDGEYTVTLELGKFEPYPTREHVVIVDNSAPTADFLYYPSYEWDVSDENGNSVFTDAVKIDIKTLPGGEYGGVLLGRIWLFDLGFIKFEASSSQTVREILFENGAIFSMVQNSKRLVANPNIQTDERDITPEEEVTWQGQGFGTSSYDSIIDNFIMRIISVRSDTDKTIGPGKATYKFDIKTNDEYVKENSLLEHSERLKMQIFGDCDDTWIDFLKSQYGFAGLDFGSFADVTLCAGTSSYTRKKIIFTYLVCDVDLEII